MSLSEPRPGELPARDLAILFGSLTVMGANVICYFILEEFMDIRYVAPQDAGVDPPGASPS